jgi:hypothetical protein
MVSTEQQVQTTLVRANARAWGLATGLLLGLGVFLATTILLLKGGENVGSHLGRLGQVFPGYEVTLGGAAIGAIYAFVIGYALGRLLAPRKPMELEVTDENSRQKHVRLNGRAWGWGMGGILAILLAATTAALVARGGEDVGALLHHLDVYLPGYQVTYSGAVIGAVYVFGLGWLGGRSIGGIYNLTVERAEG